MVGKRNVTLKKDYRIEFHKPLETIRAKCLDCCGMQSPEVEHCEAYRCPLWPYRFGYTPEKAKRRLNR